MQERKMAKTGCPQCGFPVAGGQKGCPRCVRRRRRSWTIIISLALILLVSLAYLFTGRVTEKPVPVVKGETRHSGRLTEAGKIIKDKHPAWPDYICNLVGEKRITTGMSREQVTAAWGEPDEVYTFPTVYGKQEHWVMWVEGESIDLIFEDAVLISVKPARRFITP